MYKVLFISLVNWDSLMEMPALLHNGGCTVDVFCTKDSWVLKNKYYNESFIADADGDTFTSELLTFISKNKDVYDWIVPADDIIIRLLNEKLILEEVFYKIMPLTKIENRKLLGSKAGFADLCTEYNIKTPRYLIYKDGMTASDISSQMGYPMMIKMDKSEGGFGIYLCENETEMIANLARVTGKTNLVFQQYIKGYEVNTELLCKNGELIVYNYSKRLKTIGKFGVSTQRSYYQNTSIEPELRKIANVLGLNGFGNVVFMYDEAENEHYLIEVDVRPNSWMYYGKFTGSDFSEGIKKIIKGDLTLLEQDEKFAGKETFVSLYKKDIYRCAIEKDYTELFRWATNSNNRWRYVPLYDMRTFLSCTTYLIGVFEGLFATRFQKNLTFNFHFSIPRFNFFHKANPAHIG